LFYGRLLRRDHGIFMDFVAMFLVSKVIGSWKGDDALFNLFSV
jgi:hypothetical protein